MEHINVCIVGGGASGVFAAIRARTLGARVTLVEKGPRLLAKVERSGGGRCNFAHAVFDTNVLSSHYPRGSRELVGPFHRFQTQDTIDWFAIRGVQSKVESDGRIFPTSNTSKVVVQCLEKELEGVSVIYNTTICTIHRRADGFHLCFSDGACLDCDMLILATGSSADGYLFAEQLGHTIIPPVPSLFPLAVKDFSLSHLAGVSVPTVSVRLQGGKYMRQGSLLITHSGFSGPVIQHVTALEARMLAQHSYTGELIINWVLSRCVEDELVHLKKCHPSKEPMNIFSLPKALWHHMLASSGCRKRMNDISRREIRLLANMLEKDTYSIRGRAKHKGEFVTCGGVALSEIDMRTMESKICPHLRFAGEILDIDGLTGGFNLQAAWTTGFVAGSV